MKQQIAAQSRFSSITPDSPEFETWNTRGANLRFKGTPSAIIPVSNTEDLMLALQQTIDKKQRIAVRGGGHCLENFVCNPSIDVVIDISMMKGVRYDDSMSAIEINAGTTLGEMHIELYNRWGIVLPSGEHPAIGIGGHIQGGAFGFLCRQHGLGVDYLYALEMVWIDSNRQVQKLIATIEDDDCNYELWWAHTGGGAGNFGIVTRYWFRTPGVSSKHPQELLPKAPDVVETFEVDWNWDNFTEEKFHKLVANFGAWSAANAGSTIASRELFATLHLWHKAMGKIQLKGLLTDLSHADTIVTELMDSLTEGVDIPFEIKHTKLSWLAFALNPFPEIFEGDKIAFKLKDAFLLKPFTAEQIKVAYEHLTKPTDTPGGFIGMATYGGKVNTIPKHATAAPQRSAILTTSCTSGWSNDEDEARYLEAVRGCYSELFADTGGVPVPGERYGGCIIAHPDNDMNDPAFNKSGLPWHDFYYQDNYPRLQKIKARWDPCNIFNHALSIEPWSGKDL